MAGLILGISLPALDESHLCSDEDSRRAIAMLVDQRSILQTQPGCAHPNHRFDTGLKKDKKKNPRGNLRGFNQGASTIPSYSPRSVDPECLKRFIDFLYFGVNCRVSVILCLLPLN